jgi:hypothetical protein
MGWKVYEWTGWAYKDKEQSKLPPMTTEETAKAVEYLRENNYPHPEDCPGEACPGYRCACGVGICHVAVRLCGDF